MGIASTPLAGRATKADAYWYRCNFGACNAGFTEEVGKPPCCACWPWAECSARSSSPPPAYPHMLTLPPSSHRPLSAGGQRPCTAVRQHRCDAAAGGRCVCGGRLQWRGEARGGSGGGNQAAVSRGGCCMVYHPLAPAPAWPHAGPYLVTQTTPATLPPRRRRVLLRDGVQPGEGWTLAQYNDPGTAPPFRRNEVLIPLEGFSLW